MLLPFMHSDLIEAGCDEAGRGCLCGPVACAAVILPENFSEVRLPDGRLAAEMLDDSKKLTQRRRELLRPVIESSARAWCVVMVEAAEIDAINILQASITGMQRAVRGLTLTPGHILVDGNRFAPMPEGIPYTTVVHGDATYMSIAAASVLAKTHRDALMLRLAGEFPGYGWERNMGYPTKEHREAIARLGVTPHHRITFKF